MLEPIEIMGVDAFGESEVVIKARIKTLPIEQWSVGREYRRRLKKAFDRENIEIPFPHRTLYMGEASPPWLVKNVVSATAS
jgi:small conductance mechanosensitive channel